MLTPRYARSFHSATPPWLKHALKRGLFGLYVLVLLEVFGQLTMRITSGGWPDRAT